MKKQFISIFIYYAYINHPRKVTDFYYRTCLLLDEYTIAIAEP